ncbi:type II toxin-antitoxin system VapC family toxin [Amaricoccus sp.]|uniref:type II toxin-antitoxin system VapC family toxin n=1 Tax=Amaricoccus sp. TaxID=1872485 RepID=UPI001B61850D|nr:type II toxin-antitoxin system VapC family toxin [Amaricoccus sp.]MBP7243425.1 type II toxin-antitoxin system VapC family toxin [Amaricoccus sp.]
MSERVASERIVLDASALLAIVFGEPGEERALELVERGMVSTVNLSEAAAKMNERGLDEGEAERLLGALGFDLAGFGEAEAYAAGRLRAATRAAGLSFGDRACLALALREALPVATADRAWAALDLGVAVEMIR